jgi:hypothetical protein
MSSQLLHCQRCQKDFTPLMPSRLEEDDARGLPVLCDGCRYHHQAKELAHA